MKDRLDAVVGRLAGFFKIGVNLMLTILQAIGITAEDLVDEKKITIIIEVLTKHFMLSAKEKKELEKLLEIFLTY